MSGTERRYEVPVIHPDTGSEYEIEVFAQSPREAIQKAVDQSIHDDVHVSRPWVDEHILDESEGGRE